MERLGLMAKKQALSKAAWIRMRSRGLGFRVSGGPCGCAVLLAVSFFHSLNLC